MKIWELLCERDRWSQGSVAKTHNGKPCSISDTNVYSYALDGALNKCYLTDNTPDQCKIWHNTQETIINAINRKYNQEKPYLCVWTWNDTKERTYEEVVELMMDLDL